MSVRSLFAMLFACSQCILTAGDRHAMAEQRDAIAEQRDAVAKQRLAPSTRPLPSSQLEFIPNRGQFRLAPGCTDTLLFAAYGAGTSCYLSRNAIHYVQRQHRIDVVFVGANPRPRISEHDTTDGTLNYYLDGARVEGVRAVRRLTYHNLYEHIDLVLYAGDNGLKYDFVVHPGGNPDDIVMRYVGALGVAVLRDGRCKAKTTDGSIDELRPFTYQLNSSIPQTVSRRTTRINSSFVRKGNEIGFRVGRYDRARDLVIDPSVSWSTYYGGSSVDWGMGVRTDADGNVVLSGGTSSTTFIATPGAHDETVQVSDAFIVKFNTNGVRQWSTYFGGNAAEGASGLAIADNGTIFIGGVTSSANIATAGAHKTVLGGLRDLFLASFTADGQLRWSTYYGGELDEATGFSSFGNAMTMTANGNVAIGGRSNSTTGIATANAHKVVAQVVGHEAILAVFNVDGVLQWGTYVGGEESDEIYSIAADHLHHHLVVAGSTRSETNVATPGSYQDVLRGNRDAFVMAFDDIGGKAWGTYYGGDDDEEFYGIGCSANGVIGVTGQTSSAANIATAGAFRTNLIGTYNIVVASFGWDGFPLWGTYYGESGFNEHGVAVTFQGDSLYVGGFLSSPANVATSDGMQTAAGGGQDAFVVKFDANGQRIWGSYFGGSSHEVGTGIHADANYNIYLAGFTQSVNGISTPGAHQTTRQSGVDGYVAKICDLPKPLLLVLPNDSLCAGEVVNIDVASVSPSVRWFDGSTALTALNDQRRYTTPATLTTGTHSIWVEVGGNGCYSRSDTMKIYVHARPVVVAMNDTSVCQDATLRLNATVSSGSAPYQYRWSPTTSLDNPNVQRPIATVNTPTTFICAITDAYGCTGKDSVYVDLRPDPSLAMADSVLICPGDGITIGDTSAVAPPYTYAWSPADGLSSTSAARPTARPAFPTQYNVVVTDVHGCTTKDSVFVGLRLKPLPAITPNGSMVLCGADTVMLKADVGFARYLWSTGDTLRNMVVRTSGSYFVTVTDANGCVGTSDSVHVVLSTLPKPELVGPDAACLNSNVVYNVVGDTDHVYAWTISGGGALVTTAQQQVNVQWTSVGTWRLSVQARNGAGCAALVSVDVVVADSLQPAITPAGPITLCKDGTVVLYASKGFVSYEWSNGATTDSIVVSTSGTYSVKVLGQGGCDGKSNSVVVTVLPDLPPSPRIVASDLVLCNGDSAILSLMPTTFSSYQWSTGDASPSIVVRTSGAYFASVVDATGCTGMSDTIEIRFAAPPDSTITESGPTTFCNGDSVTLTAASGPWRYEWSNGATTRSIVAHAAGTYSVRIISVEQCESSASRTVVVHERPDASIVGPDAVCFSSSGSYSIAATTAAISWTLAPAGLGSITNGQGTTSIDVQWGTTVGTATLMVIATNVEGCADTSVLTIHIDAELRPTITSSGPTIICEGDSVLLAIADGFASYQWSNASGILDTATSRFLLVRTAGTYTCAVSNSGGCTGVADGISVIVHPLPQRPSISRTGNIFKSTSADGYQWHLNGIAIPGATSQTLARTSLGMYTVTITDFNGCSATSDPYNYGADPEAVIAVDNVPRAYPNQTVEVPIVLRASTDLNTISADHYIGTLRYNGTMMLPMSSRGGTITLPDLAVAGSTDRTLVFEGNRGTTTSGALLWITFVTLLGNDTCTTIELSDVSFTNAVVNVTVEHGEFCENGICMTDGDVRLIDSHARLGLHVIHPNPVSDAVEVTYELNEHGSTQLLLTDVLGRTVREIVNANQAQGLHSVWLDLGDIGDGWYQVVLTTPSTRRHQTIIVGGLR